MLRYCSLYIGLIRHRKLDALQKPLPFTQVAFHMQFAFSYNDSRYDDVLFGAVLAAGAL